MAGWHPGAMAGSRCHFLHRGGAVGLVGAVARFQCPSSASRVLLVELRLMQFGCGGGPLGSIGSIGMGRPPPPLKCLVHVGAGAEGMGPVGTPQQLE